MSFEAYSATALSASQTVANFQHVRSGSILPKAGASLGETNGAHDLGSSSYRWSKLYADTFATTVTVAAPVTFSGAATFNTTTTFNAGGVFPKRISVSYIEGINVFVPDLTGTAFIIDWNTVSSNSIDGASLTTNQVTLPSGAYVAYTRAQCQVLNGSSGNSAMYIFDVSVSVSVADVSSANSFVLGGYNIARFSISTQSAIEVRIDCPSQHVRRYLQVMDSQFKQVLAQMTIFKVS